MPVPSADLIKAALAVLTARAGVDCLRPVIEKLQSNLLLKHEIIYVSRLASAYPARFTDADREPRRLTSFDEIFDLPDAGQKVIFDLLEREYVKAGYTRDRPVGHCPLLILETLERKATDLFVSMTQEINPAFDIELLESATCEMRKQYSELMMKICAPYIKPEDNPFRASRAGA